MQRLRPAIFIDKDGVINKFEKGNTGKDEDWYILDWSQFEYLPGVIDAFLELYLMDYEIFVISNQSGISKDLEWKGKPVTHQSIYSLFDHMHMDITSRIRSWIGLKVSHREMDPVVLPEQRSAQNMLSRDVLIHPMVIRDFLFCPHLPEHGCACRKPKPGMIYYLATKWNIDLSRSWMIGDQDSDIMAGYNAGTFNLIKIDPLAPKYEGLSYDGSTAFLAKAPFPESTFISCTKDLLDAVSYIKDKEEVV